MNDSDVIKLHEQVRHLKQENRILRQERDLLREERDYFRTLPKISQGLKGEALIAHLTQGMQTGYKEPHDIIVKSRERLEVKFSNLNVPNRANKTKRWNWSYVYGSTNKKIYEYLVLVGEKDVRYLEQYPPDLPFVIFLLPWSEVNRVRTGTVIAINTNLRTARAPKSQVLKQYLVIKREEFDKLILTSSPEPAVPCPAATEPVEFTDAEL